MEILLFTRPGCHLCDDVVALLAGLGPDFPHRLREIDISANRDLELQYGFTIPVLRIGRRELAAPIDRRRLRAFLAAAAADHGHGP